jgi:hypothetical protein
MNTQAFHPVGKWKRVLCCGSLLFLLLNAGCTAETLFKSNFDATPVEQPPAPAQAVGTVTVEGGVRVAALPDTPSVKWARFSRITGSNSAVLHCNLSHPPGDGTYVFSTSLFFPSGSGGIVTIQFERVPGGEHFLHVDLLPTGRIRIDDDDSTIFGHFPRDQVFIVQVTLNINATSPNAHIILSGAGASGEADRNVIPPLRTIAQQFGAVRISTDLAADQSTFFATNIVVTRKS